METRADSRKYHVIYKTTCLISGKWYKGMHSTNDLDDKYIGSGKRLWYSIQKHGKENHICEILEFLPNREALKEREKQIINEECLADPLCMNLAVGGEGGNVTVWTEEKRLAQSARFKKMPRTEKHKQNIAKALKGQPFTDERRKNISVAGKGKILSDECKKRISERQMGKTRFTWTLQSPEFYIIEISDLGKFCRDNKLSFNAIYASLLSKSPIKRGPSIGWKALTKVLRKP